MHSIKMMSPARWKRSKKLPTLVIRLQLLRLALQLENQVRAEQPEEACALRRFNFGEAFLQTFMGHLAFCLSGPNRQPLCLDREVLELNPSLLAQLPQVVRFRRLARSDPKQVDKRTRTSGSRERLVNWTAPDNAME
jgi:hypothetical protein